MAGHGALRSGGRWPWPAYYRSAISDPDFPVVFPRFVQHAIWRFCATGVLDVCNGLRIDDRAPYRQRLCPAGPNCDCVPLRPEKVLESTIRCNMFDLVAGEVATKGGAYFAHEHRIERSRCTTLTFAGLPTPLITKAHPGPFACLEVNMDETVSIAAPEAAAVPLATVVFGRDEQGKAHASRFEPADAALAERAAGLMVMRVLRLASPEQQTLGANLPAGRVFAGGKAFVPFCKAAVFEQFDADPAAFSPERPPEADVPPAAPRRAVGARSARRAAEAGTGAQDAAGEPIEPPLDHAAITVGHRVLAHELYDEQTFYLAEVVAVKGPDLLQLRWAAEQYASEQLFERHRDHLALLPLGLAPATAK